MPELKDGCVQPARGPILAEEDVPEPAILNELKEGMQKMLARVGGKAPDFEASAFVRGEGFKPVRLSDFKGKWIVICFYPGDFTFV